MQTRKNDGATLQERLVAYHNEAVIARYVHQRKVPYSTALKRFEDMKHFLYLSAITSEPQAPSAEVDEMWHMFILFTRDYADFCKDVIGKFIHHVPKPLNAPSDFKSSIKEWLLVPSLLSRPRPRRPLVVAACTSDQGGSQDNGGGDCSSLGG